MRTIGLNPLEEYISHKKEELERRGQDAPSKEESDSKQRITLQISSSIVERVKNAVYWEPGLTLAAFAQMALERAIDDLEEENGSQYSPRKEHQLRGGRPLK